jgi:hypothetical protein
MILLHVEHSMNTNCRRHGYTPSNVGNIILRGLKIAALVGSQDVRSTREPSWEPSTGDLGVD